MKEFRGYKAEALTAGQLQKFFLFAMGIRFDEIVAAFGESVANEFIYFPYCRRRKGKGWRARFWDSSRCAAVGDLQLDGRIGPVEIPRKIRRVNGFPPASIISIYKTSSSGNILSVVSRNTGTNNPSFDVGIRQRIGQESSHWLGMLSEVGAKVVLEEEIPWPFPEVL